MESDQSEWVIIDKLQIVDDYYNQTIFKKQKSLVPKPAKKDYSKGNFVFKLGKIKGKYHILTIMSYAGYPEESNYALWSINQSMRAMIIRNRKLYKLMVPNWWEYAIKQTKKESKLLVKPSELETIRSGFGQRFKLILIYQGSVDGFSAAAFHKNCDGIKNTLTVVKSHGKQMKFGGFTTVPWTSTAEKMSDSKAFLFSLDKSSIHYRKINLQQAIDHRPKWLSCFGQDLCINSDGNL